MKRSEFTDSQIMDALKRVEAGLSVKEICREMAHQHPDVLQVAREVRWDGCGAANPHEGTRGRKRSPQEEVCR